MSTLPQIKTQAYKAPMIKSDIKIGVKTFKLSGNTVSGVYSGYGTILKLR